MPVAVELKEYLNFGRCLYISNGMAEAYVTVDCGPRVIHFGLAGGKNMFWADEKRAGRLTVMGLDAAYGRGEEYDLYGGHRLWTSPEHEIHSYFPDTDPVEYEITPEGCRLTPPPRPITGLRHFMELEMYPDRPLMKVSVSVKNVGISTVEFAPWAITQLAPGGLQVFPQPKRDTGLLADRVMAIWPYTNMGDERLTFTDGYVALRQDPQNPRPFKIGTLGVSFALYQNFGAVFSKRAPFNIDGSYPDFGCSFETYTNNLFLEMETLGELKLAEPGGVICHSEVWELFSQPEKLSPDELLKQYGK